MARNNVVLKVKSDGKGFLKMAATIDAKTDKQARQLALDITKNAQRRVPKDTWALHNSIIPSGRDGKYKVKVGKHYGVYVEFGTRHMSAQPFMRPAINQEIRGWRQAFRSIFRS